MIVAVDTQFLSERLRRTGTGTYTYHLLSECLRIAETEAPEIEFFGFVGAGENWAGNGLASSSFSVRKTPLSLAGRAWRFGGMAFSASLVRPDMIFLPSALGAAASPFLPLVSTILDVMAKRLPREQVEVGAAGKFLTWLSARQARRIITISEWSKRDLMDVYGLTPECVSVTYLGYDKQRYNATPLDDDRKNEVLNRLGIRTPFIIHHGMVQLRKNIQRLIKAWDRVRETFSEFDGQLVLAGPLGRGHKDILSVREVSPNREQIIVTGDLQGDELATLVKSAALCVIPSLYEGFCLPMVEAMACGTPTVASNASCIPEVSGGVLEYFDPYSVEEMAAVIGRALEDSELRSSLSQSGLARAAEFSWERCARETLRVFDATAHQVGNLISRS